MHTRPARILRVPTLIILLIAVLSGGFFFADQSRVQADEILVVSATGAPASIPGQFAYQGVLRDINGIPLANGEYEMTFRVYDSVVEGASLWEEIIAGVILRDGHFGVTLGVNAPIPTALFSAAPNRFIGVTVAGYGEMVPRLRLAAVPYAFHAENAFDGVPVGGVIDWWRPIEDDERFPLPDGFMICDGTLVSDPESPLNGFQLPDLNQRFIYGTTNLAEIGAVGGTAAAALAEQMAAEAAIEQPEEVTEGLPPYMSLLKICRIR